tara:strand:+ start:3516 stop:3848 length:333 start_codon:yes stop_codon:yes gene_type:complete
MIDPYALREALAGKHLDIADGVLIGLFKDPPGDVPKTNAVLVTRLLWKEGEDRLAVAYFPQRESFVTLQSFGVDRMEGFHEMSMRLHPLERCIPAFPAPADIQLSVDLRP